MIDEKWEVGKTYAIRKVEAYERWTTEYHQPRNTPFIAKIIRDTPYEALIERMNGNQQLLNKEYFDVVEEMVE